MALLGSYLGAAGLGLMCGALGLPFLVMLGAVAAYTGLIMAIEEGNGKR